MKEIIIATGNAGKLAELQALLTPVPCISQASIGIESVEETGLSFIENALLKARHASRIGQRAALADDSGLVVEALHGQPGIYSARFAGPDATDEDNIKLLLDKLKNTPQEQRQAYFYCAIVLMTHAEDPVPYIACGKIAGIIAHQPAGEEGFGYDPVFYLPDYHCTMAELPASIKNSISHRSLALKHLKQQLTHHE